MRLKLGMTGMDSATQAALTEAFNIANSTSGRRFELVADNAADFVIVDMDSLYGPMSFMQLHTAGKYVIGYTQATRTNADSRLSRPVQAGELAALLAQLLEGHPAAASPLLTAAPLVPTAPTPITAPAPKPESQPVAAQPVAPPRTLMAHLEPASLAGTTPAPRPQDHLTPTHPVPVSQQLTEPPQTRNVEPHPPRVNTLANWLAPGALSEPVKLQRGVGPELLINPQKREYRGPTGLKPLLEYFGTPIERSEFMPVTDADWLRTAAHAQPLNRLLWLAGLHAGGGSLVAGLPPQGLFKLTKWPQTEREYPKHFRIATAMMKGPATIAQIAEAASVPVKDVADFVNASLATGFAEVSLDGAPLPLPGLLGVLRGT